MTDYAELVAASNFSFLRGASRPEELALRATKLGYRALAICDRNTVAGVVRAHKPAQELGLHYIPGCRLVLQDTLDDAAPAASTAEQTATSNVIPFRSHSSTSKTTNTITPEVPPPVAPEQSPIVAPDLIRGPLTSPKALRPAATRLGPNSGAGATKEEAPGKTGKTAEANSVPELEIVCLPTDRAAWGRLCRLLTCGNRRAPKGECYLWLDDVIRHGEGQILILIPPRETPPQGFAEAAWTLASQFPGQVFTGTALAFDGQDGRRLTRLARLAEETGAPMVAVGDSLYHEPARKPLQDILTCIREKCTIHDAGYRLQPNAERHLKSPKEIARLYRGHERAVARSAEIAARCRFSLDELKYEYPDEPYAPFASPQEALAYHTNEGLKRHYPDGAPETVAKQVEKELALIDKLNYARYFLTVFDLVRHARAEGILCQGRGSAANSVVCYCLGVTSVNPGEIDLLFERFISAARGEPPDIDVDFEHERREEVMQYVYNKYGRDRAGIVATVISYRSKSAIREVGKALGLSEDVVSALSGMTAWWSKGVDERQIREVGLDPGDMTLRRAVKLARELTGFPRHLSQHTGGFVITRGALDDIVPIANAAMADRTMIEWDKDDLDQLGLLKVDVLALDMLTCIRKSFDLIGEHYGENYALATVPWDNEETYEMICRADTIGVFQIESRAQMSMLPRLRPKTFYDLVIEVAIVRPGPIQGDMVHPYLRRREHPEEVEYPSAALEQVLKKTLGVPLFQEQAMKIAIVAAGFSPDEADQLRRAMATFRHAGTIQTFREKLVQGMKNNDYDPAFAERCFRQIEGFGEYGFPESHAASFAMLAYVSSWIKCHHPDVFACALLNSQPMGFYAPAQIVRDFRDHGGEAREPDINHSYWDCRLEEFGGTESAAHYKEESTSVPQSFPALPLEASSDRGNVRQLVQDRLAKNFRTPTGLAPGTPPILTLEMPSAITPDLIRGPLASPQTLRPAATRVGTDSTDRSDGEVRKHFLQGRRARRHGNAAEISEDRPSPNHAVRLGFRLIKGMSTDDAKTIVKARGDGFTSLDDFATRTRLPVRKLRVLAEADAFRSIGLDRRQALWAVSRYAETGTPGALLDTLPLFAASKSEPLAREAKVALPEMRLGEHVLADYIAIRMSLKAHPMALLRGEFSRRGCLHASALRDLPTGRSVNVAGIVLIRQRPGTASGVIFSTIEDETGIANIIIWPKVFEKYRRIVLGARLLGVRGQLQSEQGVIHVVARELFDMSGHLATLADTPPPADSFLSPCDEVRRPIDEDRRNYGHGRRRGSDAPTASEVLPKGRNFH